MKHAQLPCGIKRPSKGKHSEKNTQHKSAWYQRMNPDGTGGEKFILPYLPPSVPAGKK